MTVIVITGSGCAVNDHGQNAVSATATLRGQIEKGERIDRVRIVKKLI